MTDQSSEDRRRGDDRGRETGFAGPVANRSPTDASRFRQAWLWRVRQELIAPVHAIIGYAEIAHEEARRRALAGPIRDIERILAAARTLGDKVSQLLSWCDAGRNASPQAPAVEEQTLHHELRTPLNAVIGYGEMLIEDLADTEFADLRSDIAKLRASALELLSRLGTIISFSSTRSWSGAHAGVSPVPFAVQDPLRDIRPPPARLLERDITGRVLVVDDIEANRDLLSRRLVREGCRVAVADGGRQALATLAKEDFDLVLLDLMMPDLDGLEVLLSMKADDRLRRVPVIMISALDEAEGAIRCIEAGAEDYLPKPFDPVLLRARINAALGRKRWRDQERRYLTRLEEETARFERLLLSILPKPVIDRLGQGELVIADRFDEATVLFSDLVGFTARSAAAAPAEVVRYLNQLFSEFDALAAALDVEKIKTIGDAYLVVAGVPRPREDHCESIVQMALGMLTKLEQVNREFGWLFKMRIGIHSGPVVAGIIGKHRFAYDIWGDTVNVANRLETESLPNRIQISEAVAGRLGDRYELEPRGVVDLKGKGSVRAYFVKPPR
jgi:adenylate cyclase